jgi:ribonuclease HIII
LNTQKNCFVCNLNDEEARRLKQNLVEKGFQFREVPYAQWGAFSNPKIESKAKEVHLTLYIKGKLVVQGKGTQDFVEFFLEPEILKKVGYGYESMLVAEFGQSHIGVDESGKGDYFGPLVVAGVYVEKEKLAKLLDLGVKDSKKLSAIAVGRLSKAIRGLCPFSLVVIGPEKYNQLYDKIKNLNRLLAWGHARVIENLLSKIDCKNVVLDQFANERFVLESLMERGKTVDVKQMHRGEEDIAVAAASILARQEFLARLEELEKEMGFSLPRGAGAAVKNQAQALLQDQGIEKLSKVAKLHFKLTQEMKEK